MVVIVIFRQFCLVMADRVLKLTGRHLDDPKSHQPLREKVSNLMEVLDKAIPELPSNPKMLMHYLGLNMHNRPRNSVLKASICHHRQTKGPHVIRKLEML